MTENKKLSRQDERKLMRLWLAKPEVFFKDVLGWKPWEKQIEILHSLRDYRETFVQSCNAAGKTWLAAGIVIWWVITRPGKVITTAPTWRQVKDVLWAKIGSQAAKAPVLGLKPMQTELKIAKDWFASGLSTRQPEKFAGYHGNVLIVVDEASGVESEGLWEAMDGNLTDYRHDRMLAIGNPTDPTGEFARRCRNPIKGMRNTIKISAYDVPNVKNRNHEIPHLITHEFVEQKKMEWGETSPMFQVRILGEFPRTGGESLFPMPWLERAFNYDTSEIIDIREGTEMVFSQQPDLSEGTSAIGFDVAAQGADKNALCHRTGFKVQKVAAWYAQDTTELIEGKTMYGAPTNQPSLFGWVDQFAVDMIYIDALGPGKPIYDNARKFKLQNPKYRHLRIRPFKASNSPIREEMFANAKAEAYWHFRTLLEKNQIDMSVIQGDMRDAIEKQANAIRWKLNAKGQIQIEDKRTMRAREGFSPDELEAVIMSFHGASNPKVDVGATRKIVYGDIDPETDRGAGLVRSFDFPVGV